MCREAQTLQKRSSGSKSTNWFLASTRVLYPQCVALNLSCFLHLRISSNHSVLLCRRLATGQCCISALCPGFRPVWPELPSNLGWFSSQVLTMELSCQNESRLFLQDKSPWHKDWFFKFQLKVSGACMCIHEYVYTSNSESESQGRWRSEVPKPPKQSKMPKPGCHGSFFSKLTLLWKDLEVTWVDMRLFSTCFRSGHPEVPS